MTLGKFLHLSKGNGLDEFQISMASGCFMCLQHAFVWVSRVHLKASGQDQLEALIHLLATAGNSPEEWDLEMGL